MNQLIDIKGIGITTLTKLKNASINSIEDLLLYFPKSYKIQKITDIHQVKIGQTVTIELTVLNKASVFFFRKNLSKLSVDCFVDDYKIKVDIFNRHFLSKMLFKGVEIVVTGQFKTNFKIFTANDIVLKKNYQEGIIPIYKIEDIKEGRLRKIIEGLLKSQYHLDDPLPEEILKKRNIQEINQLVKNIHQPQNTKDLNQALARLKYQELLIFAMRIALIKQHRDRIDIAKKTYKIDLVRDFIKEIGFELTQSQKQATNDIFKDLKSDKQMNRLLQGDVGSGKTIVAILAALAAVTSGYQVAVMAPTLVLSYQHFEAFNHYLSHKGIHIVLLTSETPTKEKANIKERVANNQVDIIIGTHSLIQEDIQFSNLGFVIIDEQHRFGVNQRKILRQKGYYPDILLMSATPIPRSLAISIFESSDVSQITEKPKGRKNIITNTYDFQNMAKVYQVMNQELSQGHQVYVICPLIEESETTNYFSVNETYDIFNKRFKNANIGILHGKMKDQDKIDTINHFKNNDIQVLISTTVIEVGIHVDNATAMVIINANAFGLAQLHQLRGRIGRSDLQSYCCLIVDESVEDIERLKILENTDDGFIISEQDLKLRGPGEIFGKNQAGIPNLNFANIIEDQVLLEKALEDASQLIHKNNPKINQLKNQVIKTLESYHLD